MGLLQPLGQAVYQTDVWQLLSIKHLLLTSSLLAHFPSLLILDFPHMT